MGLRSIGPCYGNGETSSKRDQICPEGIVAERERYGSVMYEWNNMT